MSGEESSGLRFAEHAGSEISCSVTWPLRPTLGWAAEEGLFTPGDKIIFCSVGAGLTFAGGLLVW
jgi:3-oxoacyl-[acyl-carrier-protein] synthase III